MILPHISRIAHNNCFTTLQKVAVQGLEVKCKNQSEKCKTTTQNVKYVSSHTIAWGPQMLLVIGYW
jgi:hypothetical protein